MWRLGILEMSGILETVEANNRKIMNNETVTTLGTRVKVGTPRTLEISEYKEIMGTVLNEPRTLET